MLLLLFTLPAYRSEMQSYKSVSVDSSLFYCSLLPLSSSLYCSATNRVNEATKATSDGFVCACNLSFRRFFRVEFNFYL